VGLSVPLRALTLGVPRPRDAAGRAPYPYGWLSWGEAAGWPGQGQSLEPRGTSRHGRLPPPVAGGMRYTATGAVDVSPSAELAEPEEDSRQGRRCTTAPA